MTELAVRHLASGTARMASAVAVFLAIGFGVAMGNRLGRFLFEAPAAAAPVVPSVPGALPVWTLWAALLLAPLAFTVLFSGLLRAGFDDAAFYAYRETGGSNLDLPGEVVTPEGRTLPLREALSRHRICLSMGRYSATAPATALAKEMGFRGATMHGANEKVLATGLSVDYAQVSARAERLREGSPWLSRPRYQESAEGHTSDTIAFPHHHGKGCGAPTHRDSGSAADFGN